MNDFHNPNWGGGGGGAPQAQLQSCAGKFVYVGTYLLDGCRLETGRSDENVGCLRLVCSKFAVAM